MNKGVKVIIAVIVSIWIFFMGFELGNYREIKKTEQTGTTGAPFQTQPVIVTVAPATQPTQSAPTATQAPESTAPTEQPSAEQPSAEQPESTAAQEPGEDVQAQDTAAVLEKVAKAVNDTKNYTGSFTAAFNQAKNLNIVDCSVPQITNTVDKIVKEFIGGGDSFTYSFSGGAGADKDGNAVTPKDVIPPRLGEKVFILPEEGISSVEINENGDSVTYRITVVAETADLNTVPTYNYTCAGSLDLSTLSIIKSAEYTYSGTVIEATVGTNGLLSALHVYMPITAKGEGKVLGLTGYATFDGNLDETWSFTYA